MFMDSFFRKEKRFPCPPDMSDIKKGMKKLTIEYEEADFENANKVISCVEDYLNLYNMLATGQSPEDKLVEEMYRKTVKMLDEAKASRRKQASIVDEKLIDYELTYETYCENADEDSWECDVLYDVIAYGRNILKAFDKDYEVIDKIKASCINAKSKPEKIACVEKFVSAAHERGPYIPIGCGGYLPEILYERVERDESPSVTEIVTIDLEKETQRVLDCLKEYRG